MRPITVARVQGDLSVIESGVVPGDVVVTDGQLRLTPNARIAQRGAGAGDTAGRAGGERAGRAGGGGNTAARGAAGEAQ
jgi:hypothetical protein